MKYREKRQKQGFINHQISGSRIHERPRKSFCLVPEEILNDCKLPCVSVPMYSPSTSDLVLLSLAVPDFISSVIEVEVSLVVDIYCI